MKRAPAAVKVLSVLLVVACTDVTPTTPPGPLDASGVGTIVSGDVMVTNSNDAGPGSFRDAIVQANGNSAIATIAFEPRVNTIALQATITYTGTQDLTINGNHASLDASAVTGAAFVAQSNGSDLTVIGLAFRNASQEGLRVDVLATATGSVRVSLQDVDIADNAGHGLYVDDQDDPLDVTNQNGSAAALDVSIAGSRFLRNGFSVSDRDGIRIDEGGAGNLTFTSVNSRSDDNAADGIELDERGAGDVIIDVLRTHVTRNGVFDPLDLDDGFDIDEAGNGSILGQVTSSTASANYEQGLDFNENDAGDLRVNLTDVEASFNHEEGIEYEEDDDFAGGGNIVTVMTRIATHGNGATDGDAGLKIREKGAGNLEATLTDINASQNSVAGLQVREGDSGSASVVNIQKAVTNGNAGNGIEILGAAAATTTSYRDITTSGNGGFGLSVNAGTANITQVKGGANASGLTGGGATFTVVP